MKIAFCLALLVVLAIAPLIMVVSPATTGPPGPISAVGTDTATTSIVSSPASPTAAEAMAVEPAINEESSAQTFTVVPALARGPTQADLSVQSYGEPNDYITSSARMDTLLQSKQAAVEEALASSVSQGTITATYPT